ncbi:MAG: hypothetical protein V7677_10445 [Motiliproteus sp.]
MAQIRPRASERFPWIDDYRVLDWYIRDTGSAPTSQWIKTGSTDQEDAAAAIANDAINKMMAIKQN